MPEQDTNGQDTNGQDTDEPNTDEPNTAGQGATRRFFSPAERFVLHAAAGGRCEECGAALADDFHADHRLPYSAGGPTDLGNAAALCPQCNRRKGARVQAAQAQDSRVQEPQAQDRQNEGAGANRNAPLGAHQNAEGGTHQNEGASTAVAPAGTVTALADTVTAIADTVTAIADTATAVAPLGNARFSLPPWGLALRPWQQEGAHIWQRLRAGGGRDMLVTATPGSGKTDLALFLAREEFRRGRADLLVVVCPSLVLKTQWSRSAHRAGIPMTAGWTNSAVAPPADVCGVAVTYAQVAALPEALRLLCARRRVFAVLDEVHRCAANLSWGAALHQALEHAQARLALSGTAWRSDGALIPFVRYDGAGDCISDVTYDYAQALGDGVLRECFFFALGARVSWLGEGGEQQATFADPLGERDRARRLRAVLDVQGDWLPALLAAADAALSEARATHPRAKGMAVAMDAAHARAVAALLHRITGEAPALALSDDPWSLSTLERFRSGPARWLTVVRMASEGYDCPDIRVVAWATNVVSEGAFRQVVARALRVVPDLLHRAVPGLSHQQAQVFQEAQVFLPADERLLAMARALVGGRASASGADARLGQDADGEEDAAGENAQSRGSGGRGLFVPLSARTTGQSVVTGGSVLPASALRRARAMNLARPGVPSIPDHLLAAALVRMEAEAEGLEASGSEAIEGSEAIDPETARSFLETRSLLENGVLSVGVHSDDRGDDRSDEWEPGAESLGEDQGQQEGRREGQAEDQDGDQTYDQHQTYDQQRQALRHICTRLTGLIARELAVNPAVVHRAFHRSLGVRQAEATLEGLTQRKRMLETKLRELRAGS